MFQQNSESTETFHFEGLKKQGPKQNSQLWSMHMLTCTHMSMCTPSPVHTCEFMPMHMHACMCMHTNIYAHTHACTHAHEQAPTTCTHACTPTQPHAHNSHLHTNAHMYSHTKRISIPPGWKSVRTNNPSPWFLRTQNSTDFKCSFFFFFF